MKTPRTSIDSRNHQLIRSISVFSHSLHGFLAPSKRWFSWWFLKHPTGFTGPKTNPQVTRQGFEVLPSWRTRWNPTLASMPWRSGDPRTGKTSTGWGDPLVWGFQPTIFKFLGCVHGFYGWVLFFKCFCWKVDQVFGCLMCWNGTCRSLNRIWMYKQQWYWVLGSKKLQPPPLKWLGSSWFLFGRHLSFPTTLSLEWTEKHVRGTLPSCNQCVVDPEICLFDPIAVCRNTWHPLKDIDQH